jgi:hypothetical protein
MALGAKQHCVLKQPRQPTERRKTMPILLWLLGIPIPLIILIMLLHH